MPHSPLKPETAVLPQNHDAQRRMWQPLGGSSVKPKIFAVMPMFEHYLPPHRERLNWLLNQSEFECWL